MGWNGYRMTSIHLLWREGELYKSWLKFNISNSRTDTKILWSVLQVLKQAARNHRIRADDEHLSGFPICYACNEKFKWEVFSWITNKIPPDKIPPNLDLTWLEWTKSHPPKMTRADKIPPFPDFLNRSMLVIKLKVQLMSCKLIIEIVKIKVRFCPPQSDLRWD